MPFKASMPLADSLNRWIVYFERVQEPLDKPSTTDYCTHQPLPNLLCGCNLSGLEEKGHQCCSCVGVPRAPLETLLEWRFDGDCRV